MRVAIAVRAHLPVQPARPDGIQPRTSVGEYAQTALAALVVGVAAGLGGAALTLLLHGVQHLAFGYTEDTFLTGVEQAGDARRVVAVGVGGLIAGLGWWLHRRWSTANVSVTHALTQPEPRLPLLATTSDAVLQIVAVGAGGSLGREGAPRQVGAALAGLIAQRFGLAPEQRRILLAAGAGAGLAAVYNVPLGGAVFTLEILLDHSRLAALVPALVTAAVATVVAWPFLGSNTTYQVPDTHVTIFTVAAGLLIGAITAPLGLLFRIAMTRARTHAPTGWRAALTVPVTFAATGALAIAYPQLLGNGKNLAELAFAGTLTAGLAAALTVLKPVATGACLGSGAIGGLLTPSFATGATLGALLGYLPALGTPSHTDCALLGAAAFLAVAQRAPWTAIVLTVEFTGVGATFVVPIVCAVAATKVAELGIAKLGHEAMARRQDSRR